jgi:hypothetical protein
MRRGALAWLLALAACHAPPPVRIEATPGAGISIALYDTFALVDDRRSVDIGGGALELEHVDPGAALASLVIEPLGGAHALHIGACTRDALPELAPLPGDAKAKAPAPDTTAHYAPVVRCRADGPPGRYLVRVLYVSTALRYRAQHDVNVARPDRATVVSRFAVATPAWHQRADVVIYEGVPGGAHLPREIVRGTAELDGSVAVLAPPAREVPAQLEAIFDGAQVLGAKPADNAAALDSTWAQGSTQDVWMWLDLGKLQLAPGPMHVHVELPGDGARDAAVPADHREEGTSPDAPLRVPLWIDPSLHGFRQRFADFADDAALAERFLITVANVGDAPREVWVEEPLRAVRKRWLVRSWPGKATIAGEHVHARVVVRPGKLERVGFSVAYGE